jgi:hypothetical protein
MIPRAPKLLDDKRHHSLFFFGRAKMRFVLSAMARARPGTRIVLAAHPHLALPGAQMKLLQPKLKMLVISHGVEVWLRLPGVAASWVPQIRDFSWGLAGIQSSKPSKSGGYIVESERGLIPY